MARKCFTVRKAAKPLVAWRASPSIPCSALVTFFFASTADIILMTVKSAASDAAGREHRDVGTDRVDHLRHEHHGGDLPRVAAGFGALRDDDVHAHRALRLRVLGLSAQRADEDAAADHAIMKGQQIVDQLGERVFS